MLLFKNNDRRTNFLGMFKVSLRTAYYFLGRRNFFCNDNWFDVQEHSFDSFKLFTNEIFQKSRFNKDWLLIFVHV